MPADDGLAVQDLDKLDIEKLTPLSPDVISRQVSASGHWRLGSEAATSDPTGSEAARAEQVEGAEATARLVLVLACDRYLRK